jgi:hypothetical protein
MQRQGFAGTMDWIAETKICKSSTQSPRFRKERTGADEDGDHFVESAASPVDNKRHQWKQLGAN